MSLYNHQNFECQRRHGRRNSVRCLCIFSDDMDRCPPPVDNYDENDDQDCDDDKTIQNFAKSCTIQVLVVHWGKIWHTDEGHDDSSTSCLSNSRWYLWSCVFCAWWWWGWWWLSCCWWWWSCCWWWWRRQFYLLPQQLLDGRLKNTAAWLLHPLAIIIIIIMMEMIMIMMINGKWGLWRLFLQLMAGLSAWTWLAFCGNNDFFKLQKS